MVVLRVVFEVAAAVRAPVLGGHAAEGAGAATADVLFEPHQQEVVGGIFQAQLRLAPLHRAAGTGNLGLVTPAIAAHDPGRLLTLLGRLPALLLRRFRARQLLVRRHDSLEGLLALGRVAVLVRVHLDGELAIRLAHVGRRAVGVHVDATEREKGRVGGASLRAVDDGLDQPRRAASSSSSSSCASAGTGSGSTRTRAGCGFDRDEVVSQPAHELVFRAHHVQAVGGEGLADGWEAELLRLHSLREVETVAVAGATVARMGAESPRLGACARRALAGGAVARHLPSSWAW